MPQRLYSMPSQGDRQTPVEIRCLANFRQLISEESAAGWLKEDVVWGTSGGHENLETRGSKKKEKRGGK